MSQTKINGATQIQAGTVPWSAMAAGAIVPISSIVNGSQILLSTGAVAMGAAFSLGGYTAQNSGAPVNATDLATKAYIDAKVGGIGGFHDVNWLQATNMGATSGLTLADGTAVAGDLVLLTAQTTQAQNGPWVVAAGGWSRPSWWASATVVSNGQYFLVDEGATYKDSKWFCTTLGTITVDTTAVAFSQDLSGATYTASTGLQLVGGAFSVLYGATATTAAAGNDSRITGALQTSALGANVQTALGVAVGTAGSPLINGGALGTPSSGTLTYAGGLPISTGVSGLGTGVAAALALATGASGGFPALAAGGYLAAADFPALTGDVTTTAGSLNTTVNNTSSTGFVKYTDFVENELPTGAINGSNTSFTLANTPATCKSSVSSLDLYLNGVLLQPGAGNDYTLSSATITALLIPQTGDKLTACYMV